MDCNRARDLLGAYRDGELGPDDRAAVATHVASCRACGDALDDFERLGRGLVAEGRRAMPPSLAEKIRRTLDTEDADTVVNAAPPRLLPRPLVLTRSYGWVRQAAVLLVACGLSAASGWSLASRGISNDRVAHDVVSAHVRSLLQDNLVQVANSDQHTVRPWFAGRTEFAPEVKNLAAQGFTLLGGRIDYVDGRRTSVLVYKRRLHTINVFMWPSVGAADSGPVSTTRNGYNLLSATKGGVTTWLASDLNVDELRELAALI